MQDHIFCTKCFNDQDFEEKKDVIINEVRGEKFQEKITKYICQNCGEDIIEDEEFDNALLNSYNKYRKKHNMLLPEDIKNIRNKYGLSQRALSRLLGWGQVTIHRYENGALQDKAHDQLLSFIKKPDNMLELLEDNRQNIKEKLYKKIKSKAENLILKLSITDNIYIKKLQSIPVEYRGNQDFNIDKFYNMILFFSQNINKLWKTKLFKLIFYSEFLHFKNNNKSIAGTPFIHWQHGPVPKHIFALLDILIEDYKVIELEEIIEYYEGNVIKNNNDFDQTEFSEKEMQTLFSILTTFKNITATDIRDRTHKEKAYTKTNHNELISYKYAKDLNL